MLFLLRSKKYIDRIDKPILIKCYIGFQILDIPQAGCTIKSSNRNAIGEYIKQEICVMVPCERDFIN